MNLIEALNWRYATKKMNGEAVSEDKVNRIVEAARLAPTSSGLQPFNVLVITDPALRAEIASIANNQSQINDCSHLLVFAAWDNYTEERIRTVFSRMNAERGVPDSATENHVQSLLEVYLNKTATENHHHAAKQAYIAFGMAIAQAAELEVDATPMEGFDNEKLDVLLGLGKYNLKSTTILPLGYRDAAGDWLFNLKKVRKPMENFVITLDK
jgi:nitroreductase/dihydropteridine reductase